MANRSHSAQEEKSFMSGRLDDVTLPELMQLLGTGGRSVRIEITKADGREGVLVLQEGQVVECTFSNLLGEEAFFALYEDGGRFEVHRFDPEKSRRAAISRDWQELVFEAARRSDEASRMSGAPTRENVVRLPTSEGMEALFFDPPEPQPEAKLGGESFERPKPLPTECSEDLQLSFQDLFELAMKAYLRRDLEEAQRFFQRCNELRPHDPRVRANLSRLTKTRKGR